MLFDPKDVRLHHLGLATCALLGLVVVVLVIPKGRRRVFLRKLAWGWISGLSAGAIIVALFYIPIVGYFLMVSLDNLLPYLWKIGIRLPVLGTVLFAFTALGVFIGLIAGIGAVLRPAHGTEPDAEAQG
jgi:hypothetical protein